MVDGVLRARSADPTSTVPVETKENQMRSELIQDQADLREAVRERYAAAATKAARGAHEEARQAEASCCGTSGSGGCQTEVFGGDLYEGDEAEGATGDAVAASLGCGAPTAVADLHDGEVVLDLGSGRGADVLISARRVGPSGRAIGVDMNDEMLEFARANARAGGGSQRRVREGPHRGDPARGCLRRAW